jgi:hypothetical protein
MQPQPTCTQSYAKLLGVVDTQTAKSEWVLRPYPCHNAFPPCTTSVLVQRKALNILFRALMNHGSMSKMRQVWIGIADKVDLIRARWPLLFTIAISNRCSIMKIMTVTVSSFHP